MAERNFLRLRRGKCPLSGIEQSHSTSIAWAQLDGEQLCQEELGDPHGQQAVPKNVLAESKAKYMFGFLSKKEANRSGEVILPLYLPLGKPCLQHCLQFCVTGTHEQAQWEAEEAGALHT